MLAPVARCPHDRPTTQKLRKSRFRMKPRNYFCLGIITGSSGSDERCSRPTEGKRIYCPDCAERLALFVDINKIG